MANVQDGFVILNNGIKMPQIGFGTFQCTSEEAEAAVKSAIKTGYRHIDTAFVYMDEDGVGKAVKEMIAQGTVKREDLFIVTKLWCTGHRPEDVKIHFEESRRRLGLDYVDLYLIHWPYSYQSTVDSDINQLFPRNDKGEMITVDIPPLETWKAMEKLVDEGLTRSIGVSNFNSVQLKELVEKGRIKPAVNQIEVHPFNSNDKLVNFCHSLGVAVTAYSPFASPQRPWGIPEEPVVFDEPKLAQLAEKNKRTKGQVILRWLIQRNVIIIPKSVRPERIQENFNIRDFELSAEDMAVVDSLNRDLRLVIPYVQKDGKRVPKDADAPHFPFHIPF